VGDVPDWLRPPQPPESPEDKQLRLAIEELSQREQGAAHVAEYAAQDAQRQGEQDAMAVQRRAAAIKSAQRVNLASKGLDLTYGTAADLQDQTDFFGQADAATARTNAGREAWSRRAGGQQALAEGQFARSNANLQAAGTMLSGAGQVSDKWYKYNRGGSGLAISGATYDR
jgi:hypothetical protein